MIKQSEIKKVLLIEDIQEYVQLINEMLKGAKDVRFHLDCVDCLSTGLKRLAGERIDVVLLDLGLPDSKGLGTFTKVHNQAPEVPIVVLTGLDDEELANRAVRDGAQDYLVKSQVDSNLLERALRYAIERKRAEKELEQINKVLKQERHMFISGPVVVFKWQNKEGWPVEYVSPNVKDVFGYSVEELLSGKPPYAEIVPKEDIGRVSNEVATYSESGVEDFEHKPYRIIRKDRKVIWIADYTTILRDEAGKIIHYLGYIVDITERKKAEEELQKRLDELEIYYIGSKGREKRIMELKHKVNELLEELGKEKRYGV